ncbi:MAG: aspartate aminotransferase family protein [Saprospiraceae bacterium]|nr:aspartate aminotransferase family protein [Saprospiraceae bacterium]
MQLFDVYPLNPITIVKGKGSYVWDSEGTRYLDMYGGHAVISVGHSNDHWVKKIQDQVATLAFYSNSVIIDLQNQLADLLGEVSGKKDYQLFLVNSGAEANENALKLASFHTGRKKAVAFSKSFHGRTSLAVAATDSPSIVAPINETDNIIFSPFNDIQALQEVFKNNGNEIAAVIVEGIQGVGGINVATDEFLLEIRNLCDQYGSLYIADAIQCGYGRSGMFYSHDSAGVNADIYSMAKGMGNGFPIGAISIAPHIKPKHGMLGTTFGGNHLACAAAIGVLEEIKNNHLIANAAKVGHHLMSVLRQMPHIQNVRGKGLMIGFDPDEENADLRKRLLNNQKVFTGTSKPNVVRLLPSLALSATEVNEFLQAMAIELNIEQNAEIFIGA